jgi:CBS domain containing-hemolysin-like protein
MNYQFQSLGPTLRIVVLLFLFTFALILLGVIVLIALLPGKIAKARSHPQAEAIAVCGWVGLPTGILWAAALVWAYMLPASMSNFGVSKDSISKLVDQINSLQRSLTILEATRFKEVQS